MWSIGLDSSSRSLTIQSERLHGSHPFIQLAATELPASLSSVGGRLIGASMPARWRPLTLGDLADRHPGLGWHRLDVAGYRRNLLLTGSRRLPDIVRRQRSLVRYFKQHIPDAVDSHTADRLAVLLSAPDDIVVVGSSASPLLQQFARDWASLSGCMMRRASVTIGPDDTPALVARRAHSIGTSNPEG